jgi:sugar phosphate isomerase/epimerase
VADGRCPIELVATDGSGEILVDVVAAAAHLGVSVAAIHRQMYSTRPTSFPEPSWDAYRLVSPPDAQPAFRELLRRAGGHGKPLTLWRLSDIHKYALLKSARRKSRRTQDA